MRKRKFLLPMLSTMSAFFDLDVETKVRYIPDDLQGNRGYAPLGAEALSYSLGVESLPDLFEAFNIGHEVPPPGMTDEQCRRYFSPNVWPVEVATMRDAWLAYWDACEELGNELLDVFARALGLPDGWFRPFADRSISVMRANNYQRRSDTPPAADGQLRMGAHSDYGTLTILLADRRQVRIIQEANRSGNRKLLSLPLKVRELRTTLAELLVDTPRRSL